MCWMDIQILRGSLRRSLDRHCRTCIWASVGRWLQALLDSNKLCLGLWSASAFEPRLPFVLLTDGRTKPAFPMRYILELSLKCRKHRVRCGIEPGNDVFVGLAVSNRYLRVYLLKTGQRSILTALETWAPGIRGRIWKEWWEQGVLPDPSEGLLWQLDIVRN